METTVNKDANTTSGKKAFELLSDKAESFRAEGSRSGQSRGLLFY